MNSINPQFGKIKRRSTLSVSEIINGIRQGDRTILSQAITLLESTRSDHKILAQEIIEACLPLSGLSERIGITGVPGVGKSTFIEALGEYVCAREKKVAVLAIDPSSKITKGSIMGDKTRMAKLSVNENAFIRPSPTGDNLGGVARTTRETIILCEAAGFDFIIVETVGVGQSEVAVHALTDFFILLLLPGAGDELQGIKRGIVEMADLIVVNKADAQPTLAKQARLFYKNALHFLPPRKSGWIPEVELCAAIKNEGIDLVFEKIKQYYTHTLDTGYLQQHRLEQAQFWLHDTIEKKMRDYFYNNPEVQKLLPEIEKKILSGEMTPFAGAEILLNFLQK